MRAGIGTTRAPRSRGDKLELIDSSLYFNCYSVVVLCVVGERWMVSSFSEDEEEEGSRLFRRRAAEMHNCIVSNYDYIYI